MEPGAIFTLVAILLVGGLGAIGYTNNVLSLRDRIRARGQKPATIDEIERLLGQYAERTAPEGAAVLDTATLAAAATAETAALLQEAIDLQA